MSEDQLRLIGYLAKNTAVPDAWNAQYAVSEICSVSGCINALRRGWVTGQRNAWGFFNSSQEAREDVPPEAAAYGIFAYRLLPVEFAPARMKRVPIDQPCGEPLPPACTPLGFDVVSSSVANSFDCSPLSCNGLANEVPVNQFCLAASFDEAVALAERCAREQPEPGSYFVIEVLRLPPQ